jgi:hypothetical protein
MCNPPYPCSSGCGSRWDREPVRTLLKTEVEIDIPISMKPSDQRLGFLNGEGVDDRAVLLRNSQAFKTRRRIVLLRMIFVAVVEGAANDADGVVKQGPPAGLAGL